MKIDSTNIYIFWSWDLFLFSFFFNHGIACGGVLIVNLYYRFNWFIILDVSNVLKSCKSVSVFI